MSHSIVTKQVCAESEGQQLRETLCLPSPMYHLRRVSSSLGSRFLSVCAPPCGLWACWRTSLPSRSPPSALLHRLPVLQRTVAQTVAPHRPLCLRAPALATRFSNQGIGICFISSEISRPRWCPRWPGLFLTGAARRLPPPEHRSFDASQSSFSLHDSSCASATSCVPCVQWMGQSSIQCSQRPLFQAPPVVPGYSPTPT